MQTLYVYLFKDGSYRLKGQSNYIILQNFKLEIKKRYFNSFATPRAMFWLNLVLSHRHCITRSHKRSQSKLHAYYIRYGAIISNSFPISKTRTPVRTILLSPLACVKDLAAPYFTVVTMPLHPLSVA